MAPCMDSYKIKAICKRCGKFISPKVDRIKTHHLKCGKGNDLGQYEEIASVVRFKDKNEGTDVMNACNKLEKDKDTSYIAPYKRYGVDSEKWGGDDSGIINYEKQPWKRFRSDSDESLESNDMPPLKRGRMDNKRSMKRQRSDTPSDASDDPPYPKRY